MSEPKFNPNKAFKEVQPVFDPNKEFKEVSGRSPAVLEEEPSALEAGLRGAAQSASFGFSDELLAGLKAAGEVATSEEKSLTDLLDVYREKRDAERAAEDLAAETSPLAYTAGGIAGGFVPGIGVASKAMQGFKAAQTLAKAKPITQAIAMGAGAGVLGGIGASEGDLTQGEVGQVAKDAALGGVTGAAVGGLVQGAIGAAKGLKSTAKKGAEWLQDEPFVDDLMKTFNYEKGGVQLTGNKGFDSAYENLLEATNELAVGTKSTANSYPQMIKSVIRQAEQNGVKIDASDALNPIRKKIEVLKTQYTDKNIIKDLDKALNFIDDFTLGVAKDKTLKATKIIPEKVKIVPAKPGTMEKLQQDKIVAEINSRKMGENARFQITREKVGDQNFLSLEKIVDEPIEAAEQLVKNTTSTPIEGVETKVRKSYENTPANEKKARELLEKYKAKALLEGKPADFELIDDKQTGFYHVVEKKPTMSFDVAEDLSLEPTGATHKSNFKVKTLPEVAPSPEERIVTPGSIEEVLMPYTTREGSPIKTPRQLITGKREAQVLTELGDGALQTSVGKKSANEIIGAFKEMEQSIPGIKEVNKRASASMKALEKLGLDKSDFIVDKATGEIKLEADAARKIMNRIRQTGTDQTQAKAAKEYIGQVLDELKVANPQLAENLQPKLSDAAQRVDLARAIRNEGLGQNPILGPTKSLGLKGAAIAGRMTGKAIPAIRNATPEYIQAAAGKLALAGGKSAKLAGELSKAIQKDDIGRNAMIFSLMQNPEYRELLKDFFEKD